jgi:alanyl-tRNA synthetase
VNAALHCDNRRMTLPSLSTLVSYPDGALQSRGAVLHVEPVEGDRIAVLLDATACHPVDSTWPDQGADRALLTVDGGEPMPVLDCVVAATDGEALFLGADIPVRKGTDGWVFVVAHILAATPSVVEVANVEVTVDADYRHALSAGHTACHLASLALNAALADAWTKEVPLDGNANPDFDQLAIETSTILEHGSLDTYRIGKSLRRKGFVPAPLIDGLGAVQDDVDTLLSAWVATGARIQIARDGGDSLIDRRYWQCALPGKTVSIPCGGTHLSSLAELSAITVSLTTTESPGAVELRMATTAAPA